MSWQPRIHQHLQQAKRPLIAVLGPTASGKTGFSIDVCREIGGEVVNADSRQLYRGMDIGTAKVTQEEMCRVPHHLFDVLDPKQSVNIGWYKEQAMTVIDEILARGGVPVLVGGSMLYSSAVIDGLEPLPSADPALRARLSAEYDRDNGATLMQRLHELDPESAAGIDVRNKVYVLRAVELCKTGVPASRQKTTRTCPYDLLLFGMEWPREELCKRIDERTAQMLAGGWVEEVAGLLAQGYTATDPGMMSHGYREIIERVQREQRLQKEQRDTFSSAPSVPSEASEAFINIVKSDADLCETIAAKTRQYAKRQMTWWRNDDRIVWLTP